MKFNQYKVFSSVVTYVISLGFLLVFKLLIDKVFENNSLSVWFVPASIPMFGIVRIVTKEAIFDWSQTFLFLVTSKTNWGSSKIIKLGYEILEIGIIIVKIPFWTVMVMFSVGSMLVAYLLRVIIAMIVSLPFFGFLAFLFPKATSELNFTTILIDSLVAIYFLIFLPIIVGLHMYYTTFGGDNILKRSK